MELAELARESEPKNRLGEFQFQWQPAGQQKDRLSPPQRAVPVAENNIITLSWSRVSALPPMQLLVLIVLFSLNWNHAI